MFRVGVSTSWQDFISIQFSTYFLKALSFLLPLNTCNLQIKIFVSLVIFRNTWTWITTGAVCSFTVSEGDGGIPCFVLRYAKLFSVICKMLNSHE